MIRFGTLGCCSEALFRWVLDDTGISAQGSGLQQKLAELAKQCYLSQQSGEADTPWLTQAAALSAQAVAQPADHRRQTRNRAMTSYFVASQLLARGDLRAIGYLRQTLSHNPRHWKAWLRLAQALLKRNWKPHSH